MNTTQKKIPIGIEDFEKLRKNGFYYVDKTGLIIELLQNPAEVTLFTRPRRFGKSLNMSMLKYFLNWMGIRNYLKVWKSWKSQSCARNIWGNFQ